MELADIREKAEILREIKKELEIPKYESEEIEELCENLGSNNDFIVNLNCGSYRFIAVNSIDDIYETAIQELVEDCYFVNDEAPWWIAIDWEQTAQNCLQDGYAHTFAFYDGKEHIVSEYYIFRIN